MAEFDEDQPLPPWLRHGIPHNAVGHLLMPFPVVNRAGQWIHDHTKPVVPTWRARAAAAAEMAAARLNRW